jgi:hypothetical protein
MRVIGEIPHSFCRITLFSWNDRYLIKLEHGFFEQTFKINTTELTSEKELFTIIDQKFIEEAVSRFDLMAQSLQEALQRA